MSESHTRPARPEDAHLAALLLNSTQEPHFHTTAAKLKQAFTERPGDYVISETGGQVTGVASHWLPDFHPTHAWIGLSLHPDWHDHAPALLEALTERTWQAGRRAQWLSIRQDFLSAHPDPQELGFREVHRTFGGGLYLKGWHADTGTLETHLSRQGYTLTPAQAHQHDARLTELYALTRPEQVVAPPTIPGADENLPGEDALWHAAHLAWYGDMLVGLALPEKSRLDAWNAVLVVHPQHRRRGLGTALQARVARRLQAEGMNFLNTAGTRRDAAYLGVLRRVGATIEPDWIAWERGV